MNPYASNFGRPWRGQLVHRDVDAEAQREGNAVNKLGSLRARVSKEPEPRKAGTTKPAAK